MDETIYVILKVLFDFALEVWFSIVKSKWSILYIEGSPVKMSKKCISFSGEQFCPSKQCKL